MALLFLTRGWLPYEPVWRAFLSSVPALGKGSNQGWQQLFSLHVHLPPNHFFNSESLFLGYEVAERIEVEWGQWSVVRHLTLLGSCNACLLFFLCSFPSSHLLQIGDHRIIMCVMT